MSSAPVTTVILKLTSARLQFLPMRRFCLGVAYSLLPASLLAAYQEAFTFTTPAGSAYSLNGADGTNNSARFYGPAGVAVGCRPQPLLAGGAVGREEAAPR